MKFPVLELVVDSLDVYAIPACCRPQSAQVPKITNTQIHSSHVFLGLAKICMGEVISNQSKKMCKSEGIPLVQLK